MFLRVNCDNADEVKAQHTVSYHRTLAGIIQHLTHYAVNLNWTYILTGEACNALLCELWILYSYKRSFVQPWGLNLGQKKNHWLWVP